MNPFGWHRVYTTREMGGMAYSVSVRNWQLEVIRILATTNAIVWGIVGLVAAAKVAL